MKQRLREEVESPFRTERLFFFGSSTASALLALYFFLSAVKAYAGGFAEALQSCDINVVAVVACGFLTYRDWQAGEANLACIAKGGALAKLIAQPADGSAVLQLRDYRRKSRVLLAAGGRGYIEQLCRVLITDQLKDENNLASGLESSK